ncbi:alpha/beta hydrolase [Streptomyces acidiscabies]|uniref:Alpha/beta fold hydrolase n=1 Tax=Streptomyces acidiscabies TaxID=42234 RepID=A0AAP6BMI5_9ACTN|nr:alpha/beta fold hydrolase [Streptomyces acidiscabies]MDX2967298.1 alpha/beta fold hydrolase [Streptomyces acidiscabies]MDX3016857.1 alpha/beta fold hydrolase [Streptomyces acidiscabies]MDX3788809.1 alpha/beta fold hydrolase [Streptomyces acidiscabies]
MFHLLTATVLALTAATATPATATPATTISATATPPTATRTQRTHIHPHQPKGRGTVSDMRLPPRERDQPQQTRTSPTGPTPSALTDPHPTTHSHPLQPKGRGELRDQPQRTRTNPTTATPTLVPATTREITFTTDGTTTYGTLHIPEHHTGQRLRAALLLPGSGPTDRNGNQPPASTPNTLSQLADALARDKIATLRFDKYGTGRTGLGTYQTHPETLDYPAFIRQAQTAYETLRDQPETNPHTLLIVGHSEGALTALLLGSTVHPRPEGLALLQPQALRLLDLIALQLKSQVAEATRQGHFTPEQQRTIDAAIDTAITALRTHQPVDTTDLPPAIARLFEAFQGPSARFIQTDDAINPPDTAAALRPETRVLLTCGTNDAQIPCTTTNALTTALRQAQTTGPGRVPLPGVDHLLHDTTHPNTLAPPVLAALHRLTHPRP